MLYNEAEQHWLAYENPLRIIRADRAEQVVPALQQAEAEATAGHTAIGYVAYEAATAFDPALRTQQGDMPLLLFAIFNEASPAVLDPGGAVVPELHAEITEPEHARRIASVRSHLGQGDSYQVNLTFKQRGEVRGDLRRLFSRLLQNQPGIRSVYLEWEEFAVCSLSPELFFRLDGHCLSMEPMKGTRPRGIDYDEDEQLRQELLASEKERAENLMIVDMIRNDMGKIAQSGSVQVDELFQVMRLPSLWQQISTVSCSTTASIVEIFRATFPCPSITGAPKARTMEIIRDLESGPRGIYTGAIGYMQPGRQARFSVAIRTLVVDRRSGQGELGVGGGIVWDSDAAAEWQEALSKSRFMQQAATPEFSLLETMLYEPGRGVFLLDQHLCRLAEAASYFGYPVDLARVQRCLQGFSCDKPQRLRLLVDKYGREQYQQAELSGDNEPVRLA
ncbi:MAG: aminodeoxychorismate synthase component I, partial [Gammaproteobacteria bacterium]